MVLYRLCYCSQKIPAIVQEKCALCQKAKVDEIAQICMYLCIYIYRTLSLSCTFGSVICMKVF